MKPIALVSFIFIYMGVVQAEAPMNEEKIIGGQQAVTNAYPFQVSIGSMRSVSTDANERKKLANQTKIETHLCGGVLLTLEWVLTAAHCVYDLQTNKIKPAADFGVGVGSNDLVELYDHGRINVAEIVVPQDYRPQDSYHDVALLKLSTSVPKSATTGLACLGSVSSSNQQRRFTAIGWGNTKPAIYTKSTGEWDPIPPNRYIKQVTMIDVSGTDKQCQNRADLICVYKAAQSNAMPCRRDSGGSVIENGRVVGVLGYERAVPLDGDRDQYCNGDSRSARVSEVRQWIQNTIQQSFCYNE